MCTVLNNVVGPLDDPGAVMSYSDVKAVQFVFHLLESLPFLSRVKVPEDFRCHAIFPQPS